jgi:predicted anti-sigma-YlaC factor YlaD
MMRPRPQQCQRARAWASLRIDGELSELESALLDAHLGRCASCRTFAQGAMAVAAASRAAPFDERPAPRVLLPRRVRHAALRALQAAAVAVVASAGVIAAVSGPSGGSGAAKPVAMVAGIDSPDKLRELRRPALVERVHPLPRNRQVPGISIKNL